MIEGRESADALEFLGAYFNLAQTFGVVEMGRGIVSHRRKPDAVF
jgi:hypothetical protein